MKRIRPLLSVMMAMVMLFGMISTAFAAENDTGFSDVAVDADYAQAVAWCNEEGLMQGVSSGRFAPDATLTRAMVATVLYRAAGGPSVSGTLAFTDTQTGQWYSTQSSGLLTVALSVAMGMACSVPRTLLLWSSWTS